MVALEEYLDTFQGSVIVVSHDRYFLDRVVDRVFRFEGDGRLRDYPGNYSAFLEIRDREERERAEAERARAEKTRPQSAAQLAPQAEASKRKLTYKEKKELESLELSIGTLEARKAQIEEELGQVAADFSATSKLLEELATLTARLDADLLRWTDLAEYA